MSFCFILLIFSLRPETAFFFSISYVGLYGAAHIKMNERASKFMDKIQYLEFFLLLHPFFRFIWVENDYSSSLWTNIKQYVWDNVQARLERLWIE